MYDVKTQDLATPFLIGGLILMLAYCGVWYWQESQPVASNPNMIAGTWEVVNDPTQIVYQFNLDGTLQGSWQGHPLVYIGNWSYEGGKNFNATINNQGPYELFIDDSGQLQTGSLWTFHRIS